MASARRPAFGGLAATLAATLAALAAALASAGPAAAAGAASPPAFSPPAFSPPAFSPPASALEASALAAPGAHSGFSRITFACPADAAVRTGRSGDVLTVYVRPGRRGAPEAAQMRIPAAPGQRARLSRAASRCVLDLLDPPPVASVRRLPPSPDPFAGPPANAWALAAMLDAPAIPVGAGPAGAAAPGRPAVPEPPPAYAAGDLVLPFGAEVGAAAFRRGPTGYLVFARREAVDLRRLPEAFARRDVTATPLGDATLIRMRLGPSEALGLARAPDGRWTAALLQAPRAARPIRTVVDDGRLLLPAETPGAAVTVPDMEAGTLLLVGTQRQPGQAMTSPRRTPQFLIPLTWQGVVIEPLSDTLELHATASGFLLSASDKLALSDSPSADARSQAAAMTRVFDLPADDPPGLLRLLASQIREAARAATLARGPARLKAAQTLIALGLGDEALGVLQVAVDGDPRVAAEPGTTALLAVASLLSGRPEEAAALDAAALDGTDEIGLWRAVRSAMRVGDDPAAGAALAAAWPLALAYAPPLRDRLVPLIAETMAMTGQSEAARRLVEQAGAPPSLALAQAILDEGAGEAGAALAAYDALSMGRDRRAGALAGRRAVELRLATGRLDPAGAADALDARRLDWRGDGLELAGRLRSAALRVAAGQWKLALATLRETVSQFPDEAEPVRRLRQAFVAALQDRNASGLSPLDFVALAAENADLIPAGHEGDVMSELLADRLARLGLDDRAGAVLQTLLDGSVPGARRSALGLRLARLRLGVDDATGALAALAASTGDADATDLERAEVAARSDERLGRTDAALTALAQFATTPAAAARASLLERTGDWPAARAALSEVVAGSVPPDGTLDAAGSALVLRMATAAAHGAEMDVLAQARNDYLARFPPGPQADMFGLLTAPPVTSVADLPRAAREAATARAVAGR